MNVLLIAHFYPPEAAAGATRVASLAAALGKAGHDVAVVTNFPSFPRGRFAEGRRPLMLVENDGNVRTVRLFSILIPGLPGARLLHWLSSATSASLYALLTRTHYDVVIISSPPITLAFRGWSRRGATTPASSWTCVTCFPTSRSPWACGKRMASWRVRSSGWRAACTRGPTSSSPSRRRPFRKSP